MADNMLPQAVTIPARNALPLTRFGLRLTWVTGGFLLAVLPHLSALEWWVALLAVTAAAWRLATDIRQWQLPHRLIRAGIALIAMLGVLATYRTLNGLEAGTAFLVLMGGMKLLETRNARDLTITVFVAYFLLFAGFLYNQDLLRLPYMLVSAWLLTATLMLIHQRSPMSVLEALRKTARMLLQALPIAVLLFLFFPRLPGQFWALPARSDAMMGLDDEMSPGDVSDLSVSGALAFRVKFDGELPPPRERYWRGPVLHDFDGRTWRRPRYGFVERPLTATGRSYTYRVVMEPHNREWIFPLDAVIGWPQGTLRTFDYQLLARRPISRTTAFTLRSSTAFHSDGALPAAMRTADLRIPTGRNARSIELARAIRARVGDDAQFVQAVLAKFHDEEFFYTLEPPRLESNSVDDFLFNTRRGFCEHYASAFTMLARAAGIPARVVTGYQGGEYNPLNDYLIVRQSDAHAWSEVWLEDQGWVRVDPTAAVAPERIERGLDASLGDEESVPGRMFVRTPMLLQIRRAWDAVNTFWNDRVVEFGEAQQRSLLERFGIDDPDWRELGAALLISLIAFFALLSGYLAWQFRPRARDPVVRVYEALCRQLARRGLARQPHEGPNDYLSKVVAQRPELAAQINELRALYVSLRYGPALLGSQLSSQLSRFKFLVNQLRV
jgi:transglutaminase-like putative cysteine protease